MPYELLVVDDASTDKTLILLEEALPRFPAMRLMPFRRNGGSGTVRRIGTQQARGEIVVWTDDRHDLPQRADPRAGAHALGGPDLCPGRGRARASRARTSSSACPRSCTTVERSPGRGSNLGPRLVTGARTRRRGGSRGRSDVRAPSCDWRACPVRSRPADRAPPEASSQHDQGLPDGDQCDRTHGVQE